MPTNRPVISTQKNLKENQLHGCYDFPVDIHMDYFPLSDGNIPCTFYALASGSGISLSASGICAIQVELTEYVLHPERCSGSMPNSCTTVVCEM